MATGGEWWRDAVLYQIYPRSLRRLERRRRRRPAAGSSRTSTTSRGSASTGIWLDPTFPSPNADWGYDVADYLGVAPGPRHARTTLDELVAEAGASRHPGPARPRPEPHEHRAPVVRRRRGRRATTRHRDWYVWADPAPDGGPPNNWVSIFGGLGVDARRRHRPVLPPQLPRRAARPQLVERRGARRVRPDPALLVRPWRRRVPHRRRPHDREGPRAARQPARDARRPGARSAARPTAGVQRRTGPRCTTCIAGGGASRTSTTRPGCSSARRSSTDVDQRHARTTAPATSCSSRSTSRSCIAPFERDALRGRRRGDRAAAPGGLRAGLDGQQPRRLALPDALGRRQTATQARLRAADAAHAARDARSSTTATSSACPTRRSPTTGCSIPVGIALARVIDRDAARTPMPWSAAPGAGFTDRGRRAVAPVRRPRARATSTTSATIPASMLHLTRDLIALRGARSPTCAPARTRLSPTRGRSAVGVATRGERCSSCSTSATQRRRPSTASTARSASPPTASREGDECRWNPRPHARAEGPRSWLASSLTDPAGSGGVARGKRSRRGGRRPARC